MRFKNTVTTLLFCTFFAISIINTAFAQTPLKITEIVEFKDDNCTKDFLFDKAKLWLAKIINDSRRAIELEDKANGVLECNTNIEYNCKMGGGMTCYGNIKFTLSIAVKNNKAKFSFSNIEFKYDKPVSSYDFNCFDIVVLKDTVTEENRKQYDMPTKKRVLFHQELQNYVYNKLPTFIIDFQSFVNTKQKEDSDW